MEIDLEKIKKLPPDIKKDYMKMYLKLDEKKKIAKVKDDFLSRYNNRKVISIDRKFVFIIIDANPLFLKNMNAVTVVFCFIPKFINDVSRD